MIQINSRVNDAGMIRPQPKRLEMNWIGRSSLAISMTLALTMFACLALPALSAPPSFSPQAICRMAIGSVMGRDPKMVVVTRIDGQILHLSYVRPIDYFVWDYRCRIEGNRVIWASEPGRWREGPDDDKVLFEVIGDGNQLRIIETHSDGSIRKAEFDRDAVQ
jgi:hypothetical protein